MVIIVSAFYAAVAPKTVLHPYDRNLRKFRKSEREDWGARTIGELLPSFRPPPQFVILAGEIYADGRNHAALGPLGVVVAERNARVVQKTHEPAPLARHVLDRLVQPAVPLNATESCAPGRPPPIRGAP